MAVNYTDCISQLNETGCKLLYRDKKLKVYNKIG